jgi:hypothetical protein
MQVTNFCCNRYFLVECKTKKIGHRHGGGITLYLSFSLRARNSEPLQLEMQNLIMSNILNLPTLFVLKFTNNADGSFFKLYRNGSRPGDQLF